MSEQTNPTNQPEPNQPTQPSSPETPETPSQYQARILREELQEQTKQEREEQEMLHSIAHGPHYNVFEFRTAFLINRLYTRIQELEHDLESNVIAVQRLGQEEPGQEQGQGKGVISAAWFRNTLEQLSQILSNRVVEIRRDNLGKPALYTEGQIAGLEEARTRINHIASHAIPEDF